MEFLDFFSSTVSSEDSQDIIPKEKKRRIRKHEKNWLPYNLRRRVHLIPRLHNQDKRRFYLSKYVYILNSFDIQLYSNLLNQICSPELIFEWVICSKLYLSSSMTYFQLVGYDQNLSIYGYLINRYPDFTFEISNLKIVQKLFVSDIELHSDVRIVMTDPLVTFRDPQEVNDIKSMFNKIMTSSRDESLVDLLIQQPKKICHGTFVMYVNEINQITKMKLHVINTLSTL